MILPPEGDPTIGFMYNNPPKNPYLIQRGKIRVIGDGKLSDAVKLDYMGSAEFEFGALPKSLRESHEIQKKGLYKLTEISEITEDGNSLYFYHYFDDERLEFYLQFLRDKRKDESLRYTKECVNFAEEERKHHKFVRETDFWWDIRYNVYWSFNKDFMEFFDNTLKSSWEYMQSKKG